MKNYFNVGPCCKCGKEGPGVRQIIALDFEAPQANTGWGCLGCGLPNNGAVAVVCDSCLDSCLKNADEIKFVLDGWPAEKKRLPIDQFKKVPFEHDVKKHPELNSKNN